MEKARANNKMLENRDGNYNGIMANNISERASHQCYISTIIER